MRVFIAEKPSLGKDIAAALGVTGKGNGYIECGPDKVTWCFGHMLEFAEPDAYTSDDVPRQEKSGKKLWRAEDLPIIPQTWILEPKADSKAQLEIIGKLLKSATEVVHAGDPDREGQLLVDNVIEHFNCTLPVSRFWVQSNDEVTFKKGLANLKPNSEFKGHGRAAHNRSCADWLIGMNMSRAYTLRAQRGGSRVLLTIGRVQTPTLALVVARDRQIDAFKPIPYHTLHAAVKHAKGAFVAKWQTKEDQAGLDPEGRLIDTKIADALVAKLSGAAGTVAELRDEPKTEGHPRAYSLSDISLVASNKYGYGVGKVLEICQSLYEKKFTSYPRTDCAFLPEAQHADAPRVLAAVKVVNPELAALIDRADPSIKSKTWNDAKVTAHYGLIPTMHEGSKGALSEEEGNVYNLIVRAYLAQFYPIHKFNSKTLVVDIAGETFKAEGKTITQNGWRDVYAADEPTENEDDASPDQTIPAVTVGDSVTCVKVARKDTKTRSPARFTEASLGMAMENIHKYVEDAAHRKMLKEEDGIGTPATRTSIIGEMLRRGFIESKGKSIISTQVGRSMIDILPEHVKSPVLTAIYERMLKDIANGTGDAAEFMTKQETFVRDQVAKANAGSVVIAGAETRQISTVHKCLLCKSGLVRHQGKQPWWGCSGYPTCKERYLDLKGKPVLAAKK